MATIKSVSALIVDGDWIESKDQSPEGIRLVQTGNIGIGAYLDKSNRAKYISEETFERLNCTELNIGDILVSRLPDPIGRACRVPDNIGRAITSVDCTIIRLNPDKCDAEYFVQYTQSELYQNRLSQFFAGSTRTRISRKNLEQIEIPLPYIAEQKRITLILGKVDELIALRKEQIAKLDQLVKSRFIELFGLPVSNSKGWSTEKMREVAPAVNYSGGFEDAVWLLNLDMVEAQTGRILDYLYINEEEVGNSTCTFDTKNVLYSKLRPYLNKVVIPDRPGYATSELIPLKPNPMKLERTYLAFMLRSDEFVNMINEKVAGAKMPRVSMSDFREFDVPVPPMELQKRFDAFVKQTDKSKLAIQQSLDKLELLKKSLMQEYFG